MDRSGTYADVALPFALSQFYTYRIPESLRNDIKPGLRVMVQFGSKRIYSAIVWRIHNTSPGGDLKEISGLLDHKPLVNEYQMKFWEWLSEYYICTLGEVMKAALPSGLKLESETKLVPHMEFNKDEELDELEKTAMRFIRHNPGSSLHDLGRMMKRKNPLPLVKHLLEIDAIGLEEKVVKGYRPRTQLVLSLNPQLKDESRLNESVDSLNKAPSQEKCLLTFLDMISGEEKLQEIPMTWLMETSGVTNSTVNSLVKKGILIRKSSTVSRIEDCKEPGKVAKQLTLVQEEALKKISSIFSENKVGLLHGVTSSGKTEIYIHLIKNAIDNDKQVLYLLPEIALTTQIINRLRAVFGDQVGVFHSRFSDAERVELWNAVSSPGSKYKIILGARSSIFLPFKELGLVIIDEEHEVSYKQFDPAPRYHARDAAIVLGNIHGANVLLGSATPSLESYYNARSGKYGLAEINERFTKIQMPEIRLSNTREAYRKKKIKGHFTNELLTAIDEALINKEQVILFQNRRGYSPYMECNNCGHVPKCRDCDVSLTVHKYRKKLVCHYCGYSEDLGHQCTECGSTGLLARGMGTEKIEDEIQILFPDARVARLDLDSARSKHGYGRILEDFENRRTDILIGTQMISKGLDFDHVKLVGIVNADNLLHFPDFRSFERSFQLITQVSGRAGRKKNRGIVIVQTGDPEHRILQQVLNHDYRGLYRYEMAERQAFSYPPYSRLIKITFKHRDQETAARAAHVFAKELREKWPVKILGPQSPPVGRIQKMYLRNILIKSGKGLELNAIRKKINELLTRMKNDKLFRSVIVQADVDPV